MFCGKCGANVPDDVKFCSACGQPMAAPAPVTEPAPVAAPVEAPVVETPVAETSAPKKSKKGLLVAIIAVVAAVAVILGCYFLLFAKSGAEAAFDDFFDIYFKGDFSNIESAAPAAEWASYGVTPEMLSTPGLSTRWLMNEFEEEYANIDTYEYSILATQDIEGEDLAELQERFMERDVRYAIEEACTLYIEISNENSLHEREYDLSSIRAVKIDGSWYILTGTTRFGVKEIVNELDLT